MNSIGDKARRLFRHSIAPLLLLLCAPPTTILVWAINVRYDGSVLAFAEQALAVGLLSELASIWGPYFRGTAAGWKIIGVFAALQLLLMRLVPRTPRFAGPRRRQNQQLEAPLGCQGRLRSLHGLDQLADLGIGQGAQVVLELGHRR